MKIYKSIFKKNNFHKNGIISIGYFDAMHLGHKKILSELAKISKIENKEHFVLTFLNIPDKEKHLKKILNITDKIKLFKDAGIKNLIILEFNEKNTSLKPDHFLNLLKINFNIDSFVISKDFKFGHKKSGNKNTIIKKGFKVFFVPPVSVNKKIISTSLIKETIHQGKIKEANKYLGYNFFINGIVKKGKQIGRTIGFPTMNIKNSLNLLPQNSVYITKTFVKNKSYRSMTYVENGLIETYLIGYNKFGYNYKIKIDFFAKIRDNRQFINNLALKKQLEKDLKSIIDYFKDKGEI